MGDVTTSQSLELRATEARPADVGRALARLPPSAWVTLELEDGDLVELEGRRLTVARAARSEAGSGLLQMDGISRENAGVDLGDPVKVRRLEAPPAEWVTLLPGGGPSPHERDLAYLRDLLEELPVRPGDRVQATLYGQKRVDFRVEATSPEGPVEIAATTQLMLRREHPERSSRPAVTFADVGGLDAQLERVREMIELPLRLPEIFERLGIDAPKGVLLHGPPGCGKTLIARAVAHEVDCAFYSISGPEIIHKFYGESEAHLRTLFEEAAQAAPSILFLDEIDAIAPAREKVHGEVEKRVVAQLLALMDGLARRPRVIVIAATNRPNSLDPALRRPGRFDREIAVPVPDRRGRQRILELHSRAMPLSDDVDLERLAATTHGFVGADLEALCREAAMSRLRRVLPDIDFSLEEFPHRELDHLEVGMDDFLAALHQVQPSALREVTVEVPRVRWGDVGGLAPVKERLRAVFELPLAHPELFAAAAVRPTKGILLHGPPGCGKTLLARAMACESGVNFIAVKGPELLSQYVGEAEEKLREVFRKARLASPAILFFDEIDAMLPTRQSNASDSRAEERLLGQFLAELDGIETLKDVLVLGATNRPDLLDPALLRPDRFDEVIEIPRPDSSARRAIFEVHLAGKPLAFVPDFESLAARAASRSGAEIAEAVRQAALLAIARCLDASGDSPPDPSTLTIELSDLEAALRRFEPTSDFEENAA